MENQQLFNFVPMVSSETTEEDSGRRTHYPPQVQKKRKNPDAARKRVQGTNPEERRWGYSTTLKLYEDPWKIKKVLTGSDVHGGLNRFLLATDLVKDLVLPVLKDDDERRNAGTEEGTEVRFWDVNTNSMHFLLLKRWASTGSFVFIGKWHQDFVKRRNLKKGDEIGLHWDSYKERFNFSVLQHSAV